MILSINFVERYLQKLRYQEYWNYLHLLLKYYTIERSLNYVENTLIKPQGKYFFLISLKILHILKTVNEIKRICLELKTV